MAAWLTRLLLLLLLAIISTTALLCMHSCSLQACRVIGWPRHRLMHDWMRRHCTPAAAWSTSPSRLRLFL